MMTRDDRRDALLDRTAAHLLAHGLAGTSLRPMAAAAGTSDRMLLYYFTDRDELLTATLARAADDLSRLLTDTAIDTALPFGDLLAALWPALRAPALKPYMQLWLEIAARAARGDPLYRTVGGRIADTFIDWAAARLLMPDDADRRAHAARLMATLDGLALLAGVGRGDEADAAAATG